MSVRRMTRSRSGFALGACAALLTLALWQGVVSPRPAFAQPFDAAAQRNTMIKEQRAANQQLKDIAGLLREIRDDQRKLLTQTPARGSKP